MAQLNRASVAPTTQDRVTGSPARAPWRRRLIPVARHALLASVAFMFMVPF
jgi:hypothetical protein